MRAVSGGAHDGNDFFDLGRVGRVAPTLVVWPAWNPGNVAGDRRRPARSSRSSDMTPTLARGTNPTIGASRRAQTRPRRRAIASYTEQRSEPIRDEYRVCLQAAVLDAGSIRSQQSNELFPNGTARCAHPPRLLLTSTLLIGWVRAKRPV